MSARFEGGSVDPEGLSALADGEQDGALAAACAAWHVDAEMRRSWHAYHLIGDVLRSDDLASAAGHDARFLVALRRRLAAEPAVLAPAPLSDRPLPTRRPARWMLPSAIAAGLVLAVGTFALVRPGGGLATGDSSLADASALQPAARAPLESTIVVDGKMIHDARLESYLVAHKQFAGTSALGVPSAFLRSATVNVEAR